MDPRQDPTTVRLRVPFQVRGGPLFNAGEVVAFDEETARDMIQRGIADIEEDFPEAEGMVAPATRAVPEPPYHKMVTAAPNKRGRPFKFRPDVREEESRDR